MQREKGIAEIYYTFFLILNIKKLPFSYLE
jgi:hypothetical protein